MMLKRIAFLTWFVSAILAPGLAAAATVGGLVYHDRDWSAMSHYEHFYSWHDRPIASVPITLLGADGAQQTVTDELGRFVFTDLAAGSYLLDFGVTTEPPPVCTSHNRARRLPEAIAAGHVKIVAFGDSNGIYGSDHPYPNCLADHLAPLAAVDVSNECELGTRTVDWLPGSDLFENHLRPAAADADLLVFTLSGNDLFDHFGWPPYDPQELWQKILELPAVLATVGENLETITEAVHAEWPDADLVYVVYPVFADSVLWQEMFGELWPLMRLGNRGLFAALRGFMADFPYLIVADVMGSFFPGELVDEYLYDEIHPNDLGHQYYADQIFLALGGVAVTDTVLGEDRKVGFNSDDLGQPAGDDDTSAEDDVTGVVYHDEPPFSKSHYLQYIDWRDRRLPEIPVHLLKAGKELTVVTDSAGEFSFPDAAPGAYLVDVDLPDHESTTSNHARRTPQAVREGYLHLVTMGDSIGAHMTPGDRPYPERLADYLAQIVDVQLDNIHVGGSTSWEWLPGAEKQYFEDLLEPLLPDTDLLTITITGNDLAPYVNGMSPPYNVWEILQNFLEHPEYLFEAVSRLDQLLAAIQEHNSTCDIVFVLYPDFANSSAIKTITGPLQPLASILMQTAIGMERDVAADLDNVLVADTLLALGDRWLDDYLIDEVHPSALGSQTYADEIFKALGGVIIGEGAFGQRRQVGFYAPELVPADDDDDDNDDDNDNDDNDNDDNDDNNDDNDTTVDDDDDNDDDNDDDASPGNDEPDEDSADSDADDAGCGC